MKKLIALSIIFTLTFSLSFLMTSCGKKTGLRAPEDVKKEAITEKQK